MDLKQIPEYRDSCPRCSGQGDFTVNIPYRIEEIDEGVKCHYKCKLGHQWYTSWATEEKS